MSNTIARVIGTLIYQPPQMTRERAEEVLQEWADRQRQLYGEGMRPIKSTVDEQNEPTREI